MKLYLVSMAKRWQKRLIRIVLSVSGECDMEKIARLLRQGEISAGRVLLAASSARSRPQSCWPQR